MRELIHSDVLPIKIIAREYETMMAEAEANRNYQ
jgi:hypothetical protein